MAPLGLSSSEVRIDPYDPAWPEQFREEAERIRFALGDAVGRIEHVGATAVRGLAGKPILDILLGVADFDDAASLVPALEELGYRNLGSYGVEGRIFLRLNEPCTHHIHIAEIDGPFWSDEILFRDVLRRSPEVRRTYEDLKFKLARKYPHDRPSYTAGKADYIKGVLERARQAASANPAAGA